MKKTMMILMMVASIKGFAASNCNYEQIRLEEESMKASSYWSQRIEEFGNLMDQTLPRNCSIGEKYSTTGLDIFMDDLEFVGPDKNRTLARSGEFSHFKVVENRKSAIYTLPTDSNFHQPNITEVRFVSKVGHLKLLAKTCSPKVALSTLLAYAPYALNAKCGETAQSGISVGNAIQTKVQEILSGERN